MKYKITGPCGIMYLLLLIIFLVLPNASSGQLFSDSSWVQHINWTVYGGPSISFAVGASTKEIRSNYKTWQNQSDEINPFKGRLIPRPGIHIGFRASYPLKERLQVGLGLQFSQRGYRTREIQEYHDPIFQYDEQTKIKRIVRINVLEIPLTAILKLNERIEIFSGFTTSFLAGDNSANVKYTFEKKVWINGEYTETGSIPKEKENIPITEELRKVNLSWIAGIRFPIRQVIDIQISGQYTGQLFKTAGTFQNLLIHSGIAYQF